MNCMKCGVELKESGVFCSDCLEEMKRYPVKPNITVQLPIRRSVPAARKKTKRQRYIKPEDEIRHLRKVRNLLCGMLIFVLLAFAALSVLTIRMMDDENDSDIGQNYETGDSGLAVSEST